ncbi:MAG: DUF2341 domain-containing protein [Candidatus Aminicenantales bacterium]
MGWLTGYAHRKKITVQTANLDAALTDFPVLVKITADADIGAECLASGYDIRFTAADGETLLKYERETFAVASGEATGIFWVKTSLATSPATYIYLYYGDADAGDGADPTNVWDAYFHAVYHMHDGADASHVSDSTANALHITKKGAAEPTEVAGILNKGQSFDGSNDYMTMPHEDTPALPLVIEFFIKPSATNPIGIFDTAPSRGYTLRNYNNGQFEWWNGNPTVNFALTASAYNHVALVLHQSNNTIDYYLNGELVGTTAGGSATELAWGDVGDSYGLRFGDINVGDAGHFSGILSEGRVHSGSVRSAAWFNFTFHNITEADNELTWGAEESPEAPAPPATAGFTYADFGHVFTGAIDAVPINDRRMSLTLRDYRESIHRTLPTRIFTLDEFPGMDEDQKDTPRQVWFGPATNVVPVCIDVTNRVFEVNDGRIKTFSLTQNGTTLTEDADYFVDYGLGRFTLARGLAYSTEDVLLAAFSGGVNTADESTSNGAEIFRWIHNEFLGLPDAELDLDEIYRTKYAQTAPLVVGLRKGEESTDVIRMLERSIRSYTVQNAEGKIGIRTERTAAESGAPYVWNAHVLDQDQELNTQQLFSEIDVYYAEDPSKDDTYALAKRVVPQITWKYGINKAMDPIYTYLSSEVDALALCNAIVTAMMRPPVKFRVPQILFGCLPGDIIYYSRDRFPSADGTASAKPVRILSITKQKSQSRTIIEAEVV